MPENEETYAEYRETSGRFFLDPGQYILVPTTQLPNFQRDYLMRVFSVCKMECMYVSADIKFSLAIAFFFESELYVNERSFRSMYLTKNSI